jgi:ABC-type Fe3+ transport system substrate-binding protein
LFVPVKPFLRPDLRMPRRRAQGAVKAGRRTCLASCSSVARPRLDGSGHGATLKRDAALAVFNMIVGKYGWDYMDRYMANQPTFVTTGHQTVSRIIADGEKLATFDSTSSTPVMKLQGKPIELLISQQDDTPVFLVGAGIFKDAPHPNAAKLYLTWYMAREQQSRTGTFSPRSDVPPPAGMQPLSSYKIESGYGKQVSNEARLLDLRRRFGSYVHKR